MIEELSMTDEEILEAAISEAERIVAYRPNELPDYALSAEQKAIMVEQITTLVTQAWCSGYTNGYDDGYEASDEGRQIQDRYRRSRVDEGTTT